MQLSRDTSALVVSCVLVCALCASVPAVEVFLAFHIITCEKKPVWKREKQHTHNI